MTKNDRFFAAVMGKCVHKWVKYDGMKRTYRCEKCYEESTKPYQWSPSLNGETTYEVRKWFREYEPETWEIYLYHVFDNNNSPIKLVDRHELSFYSEIQTAN